MTNKKKKGQKVGLNLIPNTKHKNQNNMKYERKKFKTQFISITYENMK